jgi:ribose/xylose/arabinose/galactoside ABC-type transport system permease subunit
MIVTLGGLFYRADLRNNHGAVTGVPQAARENWLAQLLGGRWLRLENEFVLLLVLAILCTVLLGQTRFGSHLLAVGGDPASAESQGVPVNRVKTVAFCLCSLFAGLSAIVTLANQPQTNVSLGSGMELESIAAVVVGGTLLHWWKRDHPWHRAGGILLHCSSLPNDRTWCAAFWCLMVGIALWLL